MISGAESFKDMLGDAMHKEQSASSSLNKLTGPTYTFKDIIKSGQMDESSSKPKG